MADLAYSALAGLIRFGMLCLLVLGGLVDVVRLWWFVGVWSLCWFGSPWFGFAWCLVGSSGFVWTGWLRPSARLARLGLACFGLAVLGLFWFSLACHLVRLVLFG